MPSKELQFYKKRNMGRGVENTLNSDRLQKRRLLQSGTEYDNRVENSGITPEFEGRD